MNVVVRKASRFCPVHGERFIAGDTIKQIDPLTGEETFIQNPMMGRCTACHKVNAEARGPRKPQPKREAPILEVDTFPGYVPGKVNDMFAYEAYLEGLLNDPVRLAAKLCDGRRPRGTSRVRYGQAVRAAAREPMLNANPESIKRAFLIRPDGVKGSKLAKSALYRTVVVKPLTSKAATAVGGWQQREFKVYTLRYAKGLVLVTDKGEESKVFEGWGSIKRALVDSGFEVIR